MCRRCRFGRSTTRYRQPRVAGCRVRAFPDLAGGERAATELHGGSGTDRLHHRWPRGRLAGLLRRAPGWGDRPVDPARTSSHAHLGPIHPFVRGCVRWWQDGTAGPLSPDTLEGRRPRDRRRRLDRRHAAAAAVAVAILAACGSGASTPAPQPSGPAATSRPTPGVTAAASGAGPSASAGTPGVASPSIAPSRSPRTTPSAPPLPTTPPATTAAPSPSPASSLPGRHGAADRHTPALDFADPTGDVPQHIRIPGPRDAPGVHDPGPHRIVRHDPGRVGHAGLLRVSGIAERDPDRIALGACALRASENAPAHRVHHPRPDADDLGDRIGHTPAHCAHVDRVAHPDRIGAPDSFSHPGRLRGVVDVPGTHGHGGAIALTQPIRDPGASHRHARVRHAVGQPIGCRVRHHDSRTRAVRRRSTLTHRSRGHVDRRTTDQRLTRSILRADGGTPAHAHPGHHAIRTRGARPRPMARQRPTARPPRPRPARSRRHP